MTDQQDLRTRLLIRAESMALMLDEQTANLLREAAAQLPAGEPDDVIQGDGHRWGDFSRNELCDEIERLLTLLEATEAIPPQPDSKESR